MPASFECPDCGTVLSSERRTSQHREKRPCIIARDKRESERALATSTQDLASGHKSMNRPNNVLSVLLQCQCRTFELSQQWQEFQSSRRIMWRLPKAARYCRRGPNRRVGWVCSRQWSLRRGTISSSFSLWPLLYLIAKRNGQFCTAGTPGRT